MASRGCAVAARVATFIAGMALSLVVNRSIGQRNLGANGSVCFVASMAFIHRHRRLGLYDFGNARAA